MSQHNNPDSGNLEPFKILKTVAEVSIVLGAIVFVTGWSYIYGYYHHFGLSTGELNFSTQAVLVYSLPVVRTWEVFVPFFLLLAIAFVAPFRPRIAKSLTRFGQPVVVLGVVALVILGLSWYAGRVGKVNAERDTFLQDTTLPPVELFANPNSDSHGCAIDRVDYRLLLRANGQIYVIVPVDVSPQIESGSFRVCSFPESRVQAIRVQAGLGER